MSDAMTNGDYRLRIMHGGPFSDLVAWLGLIRGGRRAFVFACLSWAVPFLSLLVIHDTDGTSAFLQDWGAWAKFLIAPALLTLAERPVGFALDECVTLLFRMPLIASKSMKEATVALATARERTAATSPELVCFAVAVGASLVNTSSFLGGAAPPWAISGGGLSPAGLWCLVVGNTVFWFLLTRLLWKHVVWWRFLADVAKCRLRLSVTHPDGHGGLGFLGLYPAGYAPFTVAVSSVVAAGVGHIMQRQAVTPGLFAAICAAWLAVVFLYFVLPLVPVAREVSRLKRETILLSLTKALDFERWSERRTLGKNVFNDTEEEASELGETHDLKPLYGASLKTSALLLNRNNVLPVLVPALLPLMVAGASFLPYPELGTIVKRLLFL